MKYCYYILLYEEMYKNYRTRNDAKYNTIFIFFNNRQLELTLDRTARLYSQAVKDRRQLMDQWSQSVHVLTQRDKAIHHALQVSSLPRSRF